MTPIAENEEADDSLNEARGLTKIIKEGQNELSISDNVDKLIQQEVTPDRNFTTNLVRSPSCLLKIIEDG